MISEKDYPYLSKNNIGEELKNYSIPELNQLCAEIRRFLIRNLSDNGGHLASNLGDVELAVAIEYCFNTKIDRVLYDVGHQCYTHKILTGRADHFDKIRTSEGISGFPKPSESVTDPFIAGHGSASVSALTGIARSDRLCSREKRHYISVIGDGAAEGGMVYEAFNDAGATNLPLIIILNDNGMSISQTVGSFSKMLSRIRVNPNYISVKSYYHRVIESLPKNGDSLDKFFHGIKNSIKNVVVPESFFEGLGFKYIGPIDGHNLRDLIWFFSSVKTYDKPVVIHVVTHKGRGWKVTEKKPENFHSVGKFSPYTGNVMGGKSLSMSKAFGNILLEMASEHPDICAVTAAMPKGTGLDVFASAYPQRFFDVGMAEEHAVTMCAGMASQKIKPYCAIYSTFIQRSADQLIHDVGIMSLPVVFCIDRAGFVPGDGETHQGLYDMGILKCVPGMQIYMPSNIDELKTALNASYPVYDHPVAIRYPRGNGSLFSENTFEEDALVLAEGKDITITCSGRLVDSVLSAAELLEKQGIRTKVVKINRVYPVPVDFIRRVASGTVFVCEEIAASGSTAGEIALSLPEHKVIAINAGNQYYPHDSVDHLMVQAGLDCQSIVKKVLEIRNGI